MRASARAFLAAGWQHAMGGQSGRCLGGQRQHACTGRIPVVPASRALQRAVGPQLAWCALSARAHDGPGPPKATKWSSGPLVLTYDRERWTPTGSESEQTCAPTGRTIRRCHGDIKKQSPFKHYWNNPLKLALSLLLIAFADAVRTTWLLQYLPSCNLRETNPSPESPFARTAPRSFSAMFRYTTTTTTTTTTTSRLSSRRIASFNDAATRVHPAKNSSAVLHGGRCSSRACGGSGQTELTRHHFTPGRARDVVSRGG